MDNLTKAGTPSIIWQVTTGVKDNFERNIFTNAGVSVKPNVNVSYSELMSTTVTSSDGQRDTILGDLYFAAEIYPPSAPTNKFYVCSFQNVSQNDYGISFSVADVANAFIGFNLINFFLVDVKFDNYATALPGNAKTYNMRGSSEEQTSRSLTITDNYSFSISPQAISNELNGEYSLVAYYYDQNHVYDVKYPGLCYIRVHIQTGGNIVDLSKATIYYNNLFSQQKSILLNNNLYDTNFNLLSGNRALSGTYYLRVDYANQGSIAYQSVNGGFNNGIYSLNGRQITITGKTVWYIKGIV